MKKRYMDIGRLRKMKKIKLTEKISESIGYPLVYMGFDATCYFSSMFKLRPPKSAQSENDLHMDLLQQSLPPSMHLYPKLWVEDPKYKVAKSRPMQYQCPSNSITTEDKQNMEDCLQIHRLPARPERDANPQTPGLKHRGGELHLDSTSMLEMTENLPQEDQSSKAQRPSKSSLPKVHRGSVNIPNSKGEKRQKTPKAINTIGDSVERCSSNISPIPLNPHAEQMLKLEQEMRKVKGELQASRQSEQELRSHICNLTNSEHSLRPEVSLLRHANELLQNKIQCLTKSRQKDKQNCSLLEKKIRMDTEARVADKAQHLEYNLSAETRLKLDLFSALGDARRQLEIAQVKILKQDHEVKEMKQKLAEAMAVAPGMSYMAPRSSMPQYLKFFNSERYMLSPRALMYQCLKK
ncbi:hypothetical protein cypCar_00024506 [Cyprinus carpio]|nr:hypothetical protein cypCar_00024506 [Cyprinus carpio]